MVSAVGVGDVRVVWCSREISSPCADSRAFSARSHCPHPPKYHPSTHASSPFTTPSSTPSASGSMDTSSRRRARLIFAGKSGMSGCEGGRPVQREREVRRAVRAAGWSDWDIRIDA